MIAEGIGILLRKIRVTVANARLGAVKFERGKVIANQRPHNGPPARFADQNIVHPCGRQPFENKDVLLGLDDKTDFFCSSIHILSASSNSLSSSSCLFMAYESEKS